MRIAVIALCCLVLGPMELYAWGKTGHRVTGAIAQQYLSTEARQAIEAILGVETLAEASTWSDFMRSSPAPFWRSEASPYHYVTIPAGQHYSVVGAPPEGDAITALKLFANTLKNPRASLEERQLALRFTVHIIGDLHQPLHVGNGTDRGGNDFLVAFFGEVSNLHAVWDTKLVDHEQLSYSEMTKWLSAKLTPALVEQWSVTDPIVWVTESAQLRDGVYPENRDLNWDYVFEHRDTVRTRLSQGGIRMAAYFNQLFAAE